MARQQFAVGLWVVIFVGFLFGVLPRGRPTRGTRLVLGAAILLLAWSAAGLLWTESVERTIAEVARLASYIGFGLLALGLVHERTWRAAAGGVLAGTTSVCVVALASRLTPDLISWGPLAHLGNERLNFPLEYWNALAFVAAVTIVLGVGMACFSRVRVARVLALAITPLAALVLYLTYSRGGAIAALVGLVGLLALGGEQRRTLAALAVAAAASAALILLARGQPEIASATGGGGGGLVAVAALLVAAACGWWAGAQQGLGDRTLGPPTRRRPWPALAASALGAVGLALLLAGGQMPAGQAPHPARPTVDPAARLVSAESPRWDLWVSALGGFTDAPLEGHGAGTFSYTWDGEGRSDDLVVDSHSLYLDALVETGLPGLLALIAALGGMLWLALQSGAESRRRTDRGLSAALAGGFVAFLAHAGIDWLWETTVAAVIGLSLGCIAASARSAARRPARPGLGKSALVALASVAAIALQVPGLVAQDRIDSSRAASLAGQDRVAIGLAGDAIDAAPWFASPRVQRAEANLAAGRLEAARADAEAAMTREPREWRHPFLIARIALEQGNASDATTQLEHVAVLRPASSGLIDELERAIKAGRRDVLDPFAPGA